MTFDNGKSMTINSWVWIALGVGIYLTTGDLTTTLLCYLMAETSKVDTKVHALGINVAGVVANKKGAKPDGDKH